MLKNCTWLRALGLFDLRHMGIFMQRHTRCPQDARKWNHGGLIASHRDCIHHKLLLWLTEALIRRPDMGCLSDWYLRPSRQNICKLLTGHLMNAQKGHRVNVDLQYVSTGAVGRLIPDWINKELRMTSSTEAQWQHCPQEGANSHAENGQRY